MKADSYERKWKKKLGPAVENPNSVWDQIEEIENRILAVRPPGSITTSEYAARRGVSIDVGGNSLERMVKLGEMKKIKIPGSCKVYWQPITK